MSLANGFNRVEGETATLLRRCAANVTTALGVLTRPPRIRLPRSDAYSLPLLAIVAAIAIAVFLLLAWTLDAAASRGAGHLPRWIIDLFDDITDFGKSGWFLWPLGLLFIALAALPPTLTPISQRVLAAVMVRVGFLFTAIAVPSLFVTIVKRMIGRARPNVGGSLDPFLFSPFKWEAAYAGMPSGHATTAFALAIAVAAVWPRARVAMAVYALVIAATRLVLLAHHPSDVVAGALVGIIGAMFVRYWFAARRLGFAIQRDGTIVSLVGPSSGRLKRVARGASAP